MTDVDVVPTPLSDEEREALERGDDEELGVLVARRYHLADQSKVEIAKAFGLSRFQVARLLAEARRNGTVRIEVGRPGRLDQELARELQAHLGIPRAVVVSTRPGDGAAAMRHVATTLGTVLGEVVREGDVVGVAWSRAIEAMTRQLTRLRPCTLVQLAGALHFPGDRLGSVEVIRQMAAVAGGTALPVYVPLVVDDAATAHGLRHQPEIAEVLAMADRLDVAVLSVGTWRASGSAVFEAVGEDLRSEGITRGACGEVSGRLFDRDGAPVPTALDDRVVGVTVEQLRRAPTRVVTSHGAYRAEATVAAVRAGLVSTLVADDDLARAVLG